MTTTTITRRLERLRNRRVDPTIMINEANEVYKRIPSEDSAVQYAVGAMQPIDPEYTRLTVEERNRVEKQLNDGFVAAGFRVSFDYQGSVTNDTHILAHSDVDLLTAEQRWITIEPPNVPKFNYQGNSIEDLRKIRRQSAIILKSAYPAAKIDETGSKAINVSGGSLRRKIDIISCGWWHTVEYIQEPHKHWLGIQVLDNQKGEEIPNKPFLHNKRIDDKDVVTNGGLRKTIRLLKSLKYDSDDAIELSSYDIAGILYNMDNSDLYSRPGMDLLLVKSCHAYLFLLETMPNEREKLLVPNHMRKVFCSEGASQAGLRQMRMALGALLQEIEQGLSRSFQKLADARIIY